MIRFLAVLVTAASALYAQSTQPVELVQQNKLDTFTVTHVAKAVSNVTKTPTQIIITNPSFNASSCMRIQSPAFAFSQVVGDEPGRPRVRITTTANELTTNVGFDTVWTACKDAATGATLAIYTGETYDEKTVFPVKVPDNSPFPPVTQLTVVWDIKLPPRMTWRLTGLSAYRTWGPCLQYVASKNKWDVSFRNDPLGSKIVSRSNFGGNPWMIVISATKYPNPALAFGKGPGILVQPDLLLPHPTIPVIVGSVGVTPQLISILRSLHCQPLETAPQDATGWPVTG